MNVSSSVTLDNDPFDYTSNVHILCHNSLHQYKIPVVPLQVVALSCSYNSYHLDSLLASKLACCNVRGAEIITAKETRCEQYSEIVLEMKSRN